MAGGRHGESLGPQRKHDWGPRSQLGSLRCGSSCALRRIHICVLQPPLRGWNEPLSAVATWPARLWSDDRGSDGVETLSSWPGDGLVLGVAVVPHDQARHFPTRSTRWACPEMQHELNSLVQSPNFPKFPQTRGDSPTGVPVASTPRQLSFNERAQADTIWVHVPGVQRQQPVLMISDSSTRLRHLRGCEKTEEFIKQLGVAHTRHHAPCSRNSCWSIPQSEVHVPALLLLGQCETLRGA